jgi:hypothetical protein
MLVKGGQRKGRGYSGGAPAVAITMLKRYFLMRRSVFAGIATGALAIVVGMWVRGG